MPIFKKITLNKVIFLMSFFQTQIKPRESNISGWIIWVQCVAFIVLYGVWILPEVVGFRNTALVIGAIFGTYSIFRNCDTFLGKSALPIWLVAALFIWASFHLFFIGQNFSLQYIEYLRIWKYAALGAIMAAGLGLSLSHSRSPYYWSAIYFGVCTPLIIYLAKYLLTYYAISYGVEVPDSLKVYDPISSAAIANRYYIPKTDYVAFCLPAFSIALGILISLSDKKISLGTRDFLNLLFQIAVIAGTLFLFATQHIKNGMAYAALLFVIAGGIFCKRHVSKLTWKKITGIFIAVVLLIVAIAWNVKQNDSWKTLVADSKVGFQLEKYPHWKDTNKFGYPTNEYGATVSGTNYERASWGLAGLKLSLENPLGYGLIEDSFEKMAKARWPDVGNTLSHSHSGWLDVILAIGYPGFFLILSALLIALKNSRFVMQPWTILIFWPLLANLLLWCTTEVSATVTFAALIFWICLSIGLELDSREFSIDMTLNKSSQ